MQTSFRSPCGDLKILSYFKVKWEARRSASGKGKCSQSRISELIECVCFDVVLLWFRLGSRIKFLIDSQGGSNPVECLPVAICLTMPYHQLVCHRRCCSHHHHCCYRHRWHPRNLLSMFHLCPPPAVVHPFLHPSTFSLACQCQRKMCRMRMGNCFEEMRRLVQIVD